MNLRLEKRNKVLNILIIVSCFVILVLASLYFTINGTDGIMGNAVYNANDQYEVGQLIDYSNTSWYVISNNNKSYTLLKQNPLTIDEINNSYVMTTIDGKVSYDGGLDCNQDNISGCSTSLDSSNIGKLLVAWQHSNLNMDDLISVDDYTIRLLNLDDINRLKDYEWLYLEDFYWTMSTPNYGNTNVYGLNSDHTPYIYMVYDGTNDISGGLVRPVINVKKAFVK